MVAPGAQDGTRLIIGVFQWWCVFTPNLHGGGGGGGVQPNLSDFVDHFVLHDETKFSFRDFKFLLRPREPYFWSLPRDQSPIFGRNPLKQKFYLDAED